MQDSSVSIHWPTQDVTRVPFEVFTDAELYEMEQELLNRTEF